MMLVCLLTNSRCCLKFSDKFPGRLHLNKVYKEDFEVTGAVHVVEHRAQLLQKQEINFHAKSHSKTNLSSDF